MSVYFLLLFFRLICLERQAVALTESFLRISCSFLLCMITTAVVSLDGKRVLAPVLYVVAATRVYSRAKNPEHDGKYGLDSFDNS